jgi:radical SAM superfamily enzyme YgiQ (UPF0313 family)
MKFKFPSHGFSILYRKPTLMLTSLAGIHRPVKITKIDLILIEKLLFASNESSAYQDFLSDPIIYSDSNPLTLHQIQSQALKFKTALNEKLSVKSEQVVQLELQSNPTLNCKSIAHIHLSLSINHCIYLSDKGLISWSSKLNKFVRLTGWQAYVLMMFADGNTLSNVSKESTDKAISESKLLSTVSSMLDTGLLVQKLKSGNANQESLSPFVASTPNTSGELLNWQDIEADDRIPVYFVPHMENHLPLALGVIYSALRTYQNGQLLESFVLLPLNYLEPEELINGSYRKFGAGVWLFSNYMWSIDLNMQISHAVKKHNPHNFTIHGGPSTPDYQQACETFLKSHPSVDIAVHGEGEVTLSKIFELLAKQKNGSIGFDHFALSKVAGLTFKDSISGKAIRTPSRERMKNPGEVTSPYLSGLFDNYQGRVEAAIIETNRGCPYGCTFCDWGSATNQKIRKFDIERVFDEITWIGKNSVKVLWIADANYGLYERDIDISKHIVSTKSKYGYPQEVVVNYTKNSTKKLVEIIKVFSEGGIISQGIISIQTTDVNTLEVINRKNIKTERYDELSQIFAEQKLPLSTDLMIGLPGITVEAFVNDLQRYIDMDVSVKAYPTQLLPNSPMADPEYMEKYHIKVNAQNYLVSTYSYSEEDLKYMVALFQVHMMADGYGLLRYIMRFLQWEYQVSAMSFLRDLLQHTDKNPTAYPLITWAVRFFENDKSVPGGWKQFYDEVKAFVIERYAITNNSALEVVFEVSAASMPDDGLTYPYTIQVAHDFCSYFVQPQKTYKSLLQFEQGTFEVSDPNKLTNVDLNTAQYDSHQYFWELKSSVSRPQSVAQFTESINPAD